ncbi:MAG: alpha/beta hydrolase [Alphaproteobacteria bacterium]
MININKEINASACNYLKADDGLKLRYGVFKCSGKSKGNVLLLLGLSEFIEECAENIHDLLDRGYNVYTFEWRGQGLSDRHVDEAWKIHLESFDEYLIDLNSFLDQVFPTKSKLPAIMIGQCLGGHVGLRYLQENQSIFSRAIFLAPFVKSCLPVWVQHLINPLVSAWVSLGHGKNVVFTEGMGKKSMFSELRSQYTSCRLRLKRYIRLVRQKPELLNQVKTYSYIKAFFKSQLMLLDRKRLEAINTPVLIVSAEKEYFTDKYAQKQTAKLLPKGQYLELDDSLHDILYERDEIRDTFWLAMTKFVG